MKKKCMLHPGQFRDNQVRVYTLMRVFTGRLHQWVGWRQSSESGRVVIILLMFFANRYPVWALLTGWRVYWRITIDMRIQHGADVCFLLSDEGLSRPAWTFRRRLKGILDCTQKRKARLHMSAIIMNPIQAHRKSLELLIMSSSLG